MTRATNRLTALQIKSALRIVMAKWADHVTGKVAEVVQLRRK